MSRRSISAQKVNVDEPTINLTPLIDVVFVILIMFIVIAPLLELDRVDLADSNPNPVSNTSAASETSPIAIHVHRDNSVWMNNQKMNMTQLAEQLRKAKTLYPKARPQLFHDRSAHFGTYQSVKNAAESAGFQQMDIILKPS